MLRSAKFAPPAAAPLQVPRHALVDAACLPLGVRLVLLRAPAGFGKTTAMLQILQRCRAAGLGTGWVTADAADNDPARFLESVGAALASIEGPAAASGDPVPVRLARLQQPFALFLDDFELVRQPQVHALLLDLVELLPPDGRLVLGSRSMPDLRLGRLRARGQLVELDASRLRFSDGEAAQLLAGPAAPSADAAVLQALAGRCEGWPVLLWVAAKALESCPDPGRLAQRFTGTDQAVADFLVQEVLDRQPPAVRAFLLRTSVLRQLEPALCEQLAPGSSGAAVLRHLQNEGIVSVLPQQGLAGWRYHSLFAAFLRARLEDEQPGEATRLHLLACDWYQSRQRPVPAIEHAFEAGDAERALDLLEPQALGLLEQGRMRWLSRWLDRVPRGRLLRRAELSLVHVWAVAFTRGARQAQQLLQACPSQSATQPAVAAHQRALRPLLLAMADEYEQAWSVGQDSLAQPDGVVPFADAVLANAMASVASVVGQPREALRLIERARGRTGTGSGFNAVYAEACEGILDLQAGRLRQATARLRAAVEAGPGLGTPSGHAWAGVPYAMALYESGRIEQAAGLLQLYLPLARDVGLPDLSGLAYGLLARVAFWRGDVDQALRLLAELEYLGRSGGLARMAASARLERARLHLLRGHLEAAREELDRAGDDALWERVARLRYLAHDLVTLQDGRLRWELQAGQAAQAARGLDQAAAGAETAGQGRRALHLRLLQAAALHRSGQAGPALEQLAPALRTILAEGSVRLVLDEGPLLAPVVQALHRVWAASPPTPELAQGLAALAAQLGPSPPSAQRPAHLPLAALTRGELRVLQLLAEGCSNRALAERLHISYSTVCTHLRNINGKLDTHSRTQAVAVARRVGLLD